MGKVTKKEPRGYRLLKRYDVLRVMGVDKLIRPLQIENGEVKYYILKKWNIWYIARWYTYMYIRARYIGLGHKGRDAMEHELNKKYINVTQSDIALYLTTCRWCQEKKTAKREERSCCQTYSAWRT